MSIAERIAEHAMMISEGNMEPVIEWLRKVGRKVEVLNDDEITIHGVNDTCIGLMKNSDPITSVVQIMFSLYGMFWTSIKECATAMDIVNKDWRERVKKE